MTIDEAKGKIPDFDTFCKEYCNACLNSAFCAYYCNTLDKAERIFDRVLQAYARHNGDLVKVERYIKNAKE